MDQQRASTVPASQMSIEGVHLRFGGVTALTDINLVIAPGTIQAESGNQQAESGKPVSVFRFQLSALGGRQQDQPAQLLFRPPL